MGAPGIPAHHVEAAIAPAIQVLARTPHEPDAGLTWPAGIDEQGADALVGSAGEMTYDSEANLPPVGSVPVERHADPCALKPLAAAGPRDWSADSLD